MSRVSSSAGNSAARLRAKSVGPPTFNAECELLAPLDRLENVLCLLLASAERDQLVVELLHADADPVHAGGAHRVELLVREQLWNPFEGDLGRFGSRKQAPNEFEQARVL